jgi:hypothetical protein
VPDEFQDERCRQLREELPVALSIHPEGIAVAKRPLETASEGYG